MTAVLLCAALGMVALGGYGIGILVGRHATSEELLDLLREPPAPLFDGEALARLQAALAAVATCESCDREPAAVVVSWPDLDRGQEFLTCRACADAAAGVTPGARLEDL